MHAYRKALLWRRADADYTQLAADAERFREFQYEIAIWDSTSFDGLDFSDAYPVH